MALQTSQRRAESDLVLGDRLETDILGGSVTGLEIGAGVSGVTTREQLAAQRLSTRLVCWTTSRISKISGTRIETHEHGFPKSLYDSNWMRFKRC